MSSNYCLVLHPKHKLKYFEKKGWRKEWIATAKEIIQEEFQRNYTAYVINKPKKNPQPTAKKVYFC